MDLGGAAASLASTLISAGFAYLVFRQWWSRRRPHQLAGGIGLALVAVASFTQFAAEAAGWTDGVYRLYYFVAAPLVAVLGVGSAYLADRRLGLAFAVYTIVLSVAFAWVVFTAPVNTAELLKPIPAGNGFPGSVRIWSPVFTVPGSLALIGVALVSYWRTRFAFNLPIAAGAIVAAGSGALVTFGITWLLYLGELAGIALLFWGFLASREPAKAPKAASNRVPSS